MSELPSSPAALMGSGAQALELPSKLTITRGPGWFELSWKWREQVSKRAFFAPLLTGIGGLGGMINLAIKAPAVGLMLFGVVAACVGGMAAAYAKNTRRVRVSQGALTISSGPIGGRDVEIVAADVASIVAVVPANRKQLDRCSVNAIKHDGKAIAIVGPMLRQEQAEAIASIIREAL